MTSKAVESIFAERARQVANGRDADRDDCETCGELPHAAITYAMIGKRMVNGSTLEEAVCASYEEVGFPWSVIDLKPGFSGRTNMVKAAAFMISEIERIDREQGND